MEPDFFIFENVKGLWRTSKHRAFFEEMKKKVHEEKYVTTEQLMNSIEFGVPQDRDGIILLEWPTTNKFQETIPVPENIINELTVSYWINKNNVDNHSNAEYQFIPRAGLSKFKTIDEGDVSKKSYCHQQ